MQSTLCVYKPAGITSLQAVEQVKKLFGYTKVSYAGRLDPMAEGLLLLLIEDANKQRHLYEKVTKTYEFDVIFGISTDTYDLLGKVKEISLPTREIKTELIELLPSFLGKQLQPFPPFSSKPVNGHALFYWARQEKLEGIELPKKEIEIQAFTLVSLQTITMETIYKRVTTIIPQVTGDFRQEVILRLWKDYFQKYPNALFPLYTFSVTCSSGTYVRSLAYELGGKLGTGALTARIKRTHVGDFTLQNALHIS